MRTALALLLVLAGAAVAIRRRAWSLDERRVRAEPAAAVRRAGPLGPVDPLEGRDCASVVSLPDLGGGYLGRPDGLGAFRPFGDYSGGVQGLYSTNTHRATVAPAPGSEGGPRVGLRGPDGSAAGQDYYAADPASRAGVALVVVDDTAPPVAPPPPAPLTVPAATAGGGRLVYWLDFSLPLQAGQITDPGTFVPAAVRHTAELLAGLDVTVTTVHPQDLTTGRYVTGKVLETPTIPWITPAGSAGGVATDTLDSHRGALTPIEDYIGFTPAVHSEATIAAHEFGHVVSLIHTGPRGNLMFGEAFPLNGTLTDSQKTQANADIDAFLIRVR
jgi:hypothetical protein